MFYKKGDRQAKKQHANANKKEAGTVILKITQMGFKVKGTKKVKEEHCIMEFRQERIKRME